MIDVLKRTFPFPFAYVRAERSFPWERIPSSLAKKRVLSARSTSLSIELPYAYGVMVQARVAVQLFPPGFLHMSGTIAVVSPRAGYAANWPAFAMNMWILFHNVKQSVWKCVLYSGSCKCHDYDMNCSRRQRNTVIQVFANILQQKIPSHDLSRYHESFFMRSIQAYLELVLSQKYIIACRGGGVRDL